MSSGDRVPDTEDMNGIVETRKQPTRKMVDRILTSRNAFKSPFPKRGHRGGSRATRHGLPAEAWKGLQTHVR